MSSTLHDFVLNLITDSQARSAFELDPEGALTAAGLGDITPADVQDVVPLVVDYAAVPGLAGLSLPAAAVEVAGAGDTVSATAVAQLQSVTAQLAAGTTHPGDLGHTAAAAGLAIDHNGVDLGVGAVSGLGLHADVHAGLPVSVPADLGPAGDVAVTLDADPTAVVPVNDVAGTVYDVADTAGLGGPVTDVSGTLGGLGGLNGLGGLDGLTGTVFDTTGLNLDKVGDVGGTVDGLTGTVDGITGGALGHTGLPQVTDTVDGITSTVDGLTGDTLHTVTGTATDALSGTSHGPDLSGVTDILF